MIKKISGRDCRIAASRRGLVRKDASLWDLEKYPGKGEYKSDGMAKPTLYQGERTGQLEMVKRLL